MSPGEAAPSPRAAGPGGCGRVCARPDVPTAPGAGSPAGRVISSPPQGTRLARGCVAMSPPCLITRLPPLPEGSRAHVSSRGDGDNPGRALTEEPRTVGWLAGTVGGGAGSAAPEDAASSSAGAEDSGAALSGLDPGGEATPSPGRREGQEGGHLRSLLLPCVLPSRKRQGLSPRAAGQASSALLGTPSPQARKAGMCPRPEPRLVWPQVPHRARLTRLPPGQGQLSEASFLEEVPWGLPDAGPGGGWGRGLGGG